jgi:hypothetical protein
MYFKLETRVTLELSRSERETLLRCTDCFTGVGSHLLEKSITEGGISIEDMVHLKTVTLPQLTRMVEAKTAIPEIVALHGILENIINSDFAIDDMSAKMILLMKKEKNDEVSENRTDDSDGDLHGEGEPASVRSDQDRSTLQDN